MFSNGWRSASLVPHEFGSASPRCLKALNMAPVALKFAMGNGMTVRTSMRTTRRYATFAPRRRTIWSKMWYRPDGTPRSKKKGLKIIVGMTILATANMYAVDAWLTLICLPSTGVLRLQFVDLTRYATVDFSVPTQAFAYYTSLFRATMSMTPKTLDEYFTGLERVLADNKEAHKHVREACEDVHRILVEFYLIQDKGKTSKVQLAGDETYRRVLVRLNESDLQLQNVLLELLQQATDESEKWLIRNLRRTPQTIPDDFIVLVDP